MSRRHLACMAERNTGFKIKMKFWKSVIVYSFLDYLLRPTETPHDKKPFFSRDMFPWSNGRFSFLVPFFKILFFISLLEGLNQHSTYIYIESVVERYKWLCTYWWMQYQLVFAKEQIKERLFYLIKTTIKNGIFIDRGLEILFCSRRF